MDNALLYVVLCGLALFGLIQFVMLLFNEFGKKVHYDVVIPLSKAEEETEQIVKSVLETGIGTASNPHIIFVCGDDCRAVDRILEEEGLQNGRYSVLTKEEYAQYLGED